MERSILAKKSENIVNNAWLRLKFFDPVLHVFCDPDTGETFDGFSTRMMGVRSDGVVYAVYNVICPEIRANAAAMKAVEKSHKLSLDSFLDEKTPVAPGPIGKFKGEDGWIEVLG